LEINGFGALVKNLGARAPWALAYSDVTDEGGELEQPVIHNSQCCFDLHNYKENKLVFLQNGNLAFS
jgi:hypothetical protein